MTATNAARMAAEAEANVSAWATLSAEQRAALTNHPPAASIRDLRSGGAILTVNGIDRWCPSRRHAVAELAALHDKT